MSKKKQGQTVHKLQITTFCGPLNNFGPTLLFESPGTFEGPRDLFGTPRTIWDSFFFFKKTTAMPRVKFRQISVFNVKFNDLKLKSGKRVYQNQLSQKMFAVCINLNRLNGLTKSYLGLSFLL